MQDVKLFGSGSSQAQREFLSASAETQPWNRLKPHSSSATKTAYRRLALSCLAYQTKHSKKWKRHSSLLRNLTLTGAYLTFSLLIQTADSTEKSQIQKTTLNSTTFCWP